jgi:hypothetical protein
MPHGLPLPTDAAHLQRSLGDRFPSPSCARPNPSSAQWALFLRNHDELTLEMVTDVERDFVVDRQRPARPHQCESAAVLRR